MSKKVTIPITDVDRFISDGTYAGIALRYRLVGNNGVSLSQWSPVQLLKFGTYNNSSTINGIVTGYGGITNIFRVGSYNYNQMLNDGSLQSSQINQITSDPPGPHDPNTDSYKYSWTKTKDTIVNNFDVYTSWNIFAYLSTTATIGNPSGAGPYTGTLTLTGVCATNSSVTLKSLFDVVDGGSGLFPIKIFAGPGTTTLNNSFTLTGYTTGNSFTVSNNSTWTTGNLKNISRTHAWTDFEYLATTSTDNYSFTRKMKSNKLTATITAGSCLIYANEDLINSGVVPGMKLTKISGDGEFNTSAIISQIDYANNIIVVSPTQDATTIVSASGTVGSISGGGPYTATISGMSATTPLYVGAVVTRSGGLGSLGESNAKVTSVSSTSITIQTNSLPIAGSLTNISTATPSNHTSSGYIEFVAESKIVDEAITYAHPTSNTVEIYQYWFKPMYVQALVYAATANRQNILNDANNYTILALSEVQSTYFDGYGTISNRTTVAPFTGQLTSMNLPYSSSVANVGLRLNSENNIAGAVSFGNGEVKVADYINGVKMELTSTAALNNGIIVDIRL